MELFYAYLKDSQSEERYLITFVDHEVADEWWRFISTPPSPYAGNVKRISPQFYVQNTEKIDASSFFSNPALPGARQFWERMFFTPLVEGDESHKPTITPSVKVTDHINGKCYYIRSRSDPQRYWYVRGKGYCRVCEEANCDAIHISTEFRTRFQIQARNVVNKDSQTPDDFVLIGRDGISITPSKDHGIYVDGAGDLRVTQAHRCPATNMVFSDLKHTFVSREEHSGRKFSDIVTVVNRGSGEAWELAG